MKTQRARGGAGAAASRLRALAGPPARAGRELGDVGARADTGAVGGREALDRVPAADEDAERALVAVGHGEDLRAVDAGVVVGEAVDLAQRVERPVEGVHGAYRVDGIGRAGRELGPADGDAALAGAHRADEVGQRAD